MCKKEGDVAVTLTITDYQTQVNLASINNWTVGTEEGLTNNQITDRTNVLNSVQTQVTGIIADITDRELSTGTETFVRVAIGLWILSLTGNKVTQTEKDKRREAYDEAIKLLTREGLPESSARSDIDSQEREISEL